MARTTVRTAPARRVTFQVRVPADLHERLVTAARLSDRSLSSLIVQVLGEWADRQPGSS